MPLSEAPKPLDRPSSDLNAETARCARYGAVVSRLGCIAGVVACAAVLCSTASASEPSRLALMPLPRQALGPAAAALSLLGDSGVDSNADAARHAGPGVTAADLARDGRLTGYTLDYAAAASSPLGAQPLLEVQTIAELYRNESSTRRGLAFWDAVTRGLTASKVNGVSVALAPFDARVGDGRFAFELTYTRARKPLYYVGDVVFRSGDLLGAVFVTTTDERGVRAQTVDLAQKLATRIRQVLAGKIRGPRAALPVKR